VRESTSWRWGNTPLPEPHVICLGAGILLHQTAAWRLAGQPWIADAFGWPLILAGSGLAAWAVAAAARVNMKRPNRLVLRGPYAFSRNPMYVAWTLVHVGIGLMANEIVRGGVEV
jgi:protein-S-isoprenylcysteine O-methyltransferase Ste14